MGKSETRSIQKILMKKIRTPLIWIVIAITAGLTILFYTSQKQQAVIYNRYVETLSDYKFLEARLLRSLEKTRVDATDDNATVSSQIMTLREIVVSVSSSIENFRQQGDWMPPSVDVILFEREVLSKTGAMRQYVTKRSAWNHNVKAINDSLYKILSPEAGLLLISLDSMKLGYTPAIPLTTKIPEGLIKEVELLLLENAELAPLWNRFDNDNALILCENLIQEFKMKSLTDHIYKSKVPQVFYFLSIILLLSTLFFVFRSKQ